MSLHDDNQNMGSAAAAAFAALPELLGCLAKQIKSSKALAKLRLVGRNFHDAATPALFRATAPILAGDCTAQALTGLTGLAEKDLARYVRNLTLQFVDREWAPAANSALQELLVRMPLLESFKSACPMLPETISILHRSCPKLKTLSFDFERMEGSVLDLVNDEPDEKDARARQLFTMPDLTVFRDLNELSLLNLYGDLVDWRAQLVQVLRSSPDLKTLSLSLSVDALSRHCLVTNRIEQYWCWFQALCASYVEAGGSPLPLRSLFCGTAVFPDDSVLLNKLVDLNFLEEVYIENRNIWDNDNISRILFLYDEVTEESVIDFGSFVNARNLRRLQVATYAVDVHKAISAIDNPRRARQIAISARIMGEGYEPAALLQPSPEYPALPLHPRMLEIDLNRVSSDFYMIDDNGEEDYDLTPADELLDSLVNGDDGALEGLMLYLQCADYPLEEEGRPSLNGQYKLLEQTLPKLRNLTQLCIRGRGYQVDGYIDVAQRLAAAIPSLQYINVRLGKHYEDRNYRRIVRDDQGEMSFVDLEGTMENEEVELYRISLYKRQPVYSTSGC